MSPNVQLKGSRSPDGGAADLVKGALSGDANNVWYAFSILVRQFGDVVLDLTTAVTDAPIVLNGLEAKHLFKVIFPKSFARRKSFLKPIVCRLILSSRGHSRSII